MYKTLDSRASGTKELNLFKVSMKFLHCCSVAAFLQVCKFNCPADRTQLSPTAKGYDFLRRQSNLCSRPRGNKGIKELATEIVWEQPELNGLCSWREKRVEKKRLEKGLVIGARAAHKVFKIRQQYWPFRRYIGVYMSLQKFQKLEGFGKSWQTFCCVTPSQIYNS